MKFTQIIFDISGHIASITLNRPELYNAFTDVMRQEIKDAIDVINKERSVRVVTITGAGKAFSAGGDIKAMAERNNLDIPFHERRDMQRWRTGDTIKKIKTIRQPVIAVLNGAAVGAGCGLALACDMRFASDKAKLGIPFVKRGLSLDWGVGYFLPRLIGTSRALELACTGKMIDAETAFKIGLVNGVVPASQLDEFVTGLCNEIAENAPIAVATAKAAIYDGESYDLDKALEDESYAAGMCQMTEDHKEGVIAFLEKRSPLFHGN